MDNTKELGISLCSGYGGLERGLELAGVEHRIIAHVEIEAFAIANLVAKMESGQMVPSPMWTNLKTFPMERFRGVDFITGGYPCQPFSCAGKRQGTEDPRHLWPYIRRIYQTIQPRWMFFENVEGHVTLGLSTVISDLEEDGYRVKAGLFTASEVGAPHRRKRVFILANSNSQRDRAGYRKVYQEDGEVSERNNDAEFEQSGEAMENSSEFGRGGRNQSGGEVRECGMSEDKTERSGASPEVLGNASSVRSCGHSENSRTTSQDKGGEERRLCEPERTGPQSRNDAQQEGLADTNKQRSQRRHCGELSKCAVKWPARPGSPQYDWEEPRIVERQLGGAVTRSRSGVDAITNRVDRLRLCGNGVVPLQAAKAYTILSEKINE